MIGGSQQGQRRRRTLLLSVFHSRGQTQSTSVVRGQGYRDLVRCKALESQGHDVFTCDDKHTEGVVVGRDGREQPVASVDQPGLHVQANFNDGRRMLKSMAAKPTFDQPFDTIILDYFFPGWLGRNAFDRQLLLPYHSRIRGNRCWWSMVASLFGLRARCRH